MCSNPHRHPAGSYDYFKTLDSECRPDFGTEGNVRILVNGSQIKHIHIEPHCLQNLDINWGSRFQEILPILPPGSWTSARLSPNVGNGELEIIDLSEDALPRIGDLWHPVRIEYNEFQFEESPGTNPMMDAKKATKTSGLLCSRCACSIV